MRENTLAIVVPCYNEESILEGTISTLLGKLDDLVQQQLISRESYLLLVNDGSKDRTWEIISDACQKTPGRVRGICLSGNCGHQAALTAGLEYASTHADISISIDADLQDDIEVLKDFVTEYHNGNDIVYGVRNNRESDSFAKRFFAEGFYKMMIWLGVKTIYNHADFRLMSSQAMQALMQYHEVNLYLRGLVPLLGFRQSIVYYARKKAERPTHYSIGKMLRLAWDGITSFSVRPIRMISIFGVVTLFVAVIYAAYAIVRHCQEQTIPGWTSMMCIGLFVSGVQLLSIGVLGEYIAKNYMEVKARPRYHVAEVMD